MPCSLVIRPDDLSSPEVTTLLQEHLAFAAAHSPPESVHALNVQQLRAPDVTFWTAWQDDKLAGCGALKQLDPTHGEVKSMRTAEAFLRQGVASAMLTYLLDEARRRSYGRVSLETGSMAAFAPACALYERFGFEYCEPFADYVPDRNSLFMTMQLTG